MTFVPHLPVRARPLECLRPTLGDGTSYLSTCLGGARHETFESRRGISPGGGTPTIGTSLPLMIDMARLTNRDSDAGAAQQLTCGMRRGGELRVMRQSLHARDTAVGPRPALQDRCRAGTGRVSRVEYRDPAGGAPVSPETLRILSANWQNNSAEQSVWRKKT